MNSAIWFDRHEGYKAELVAFDGALCLRISWTNYYNRQGQPLGPGLNMIRASDIRNVRTLVDGRLSLFIQGEGESVFDGKEAEAILQVFAQLPAIQKEEDK